MQTKKELRQDMKRMLEAQSGEARSQKSRRIEEKLFGLDAFKKANTVCFYVSMPVEVDTASMIDRSIGMGKRVLVPLTDLENKEIDLYTIKNRQSDLRPGVLGIREPDPKKAKKGDPSEVDCLIVPGLCFDKQNNRLGRGAGLYDRFLKKFDPSVPKIGLAFSFQVLPQIPVEPHDVRLDIVLTE